MKQVTISDPWYYSRAVPGFANAALASVRREGKKRKRKQRRRRTAVYTYVCLHRQILFHGLNATAATGANHVTGDVAGLIGNQEPRDIGDLLRLANGTEHGLVGGVLT